MFCLQFWSLAYVTQNVRNFARPEVWTNFDWGFGCIFSAYCFFSCLGILKSKPLLFSGILMHLLAIMSLIWGDKYNDTRAFQLGVYLLSVYAVLWCLHFIAQSIYRKESTLKGESFCT
jgi:hypothetical protein